jgi:hypothetical protein
LNKLSILASSKRLLNESNQSSELLEISGQTLVRPRKAAQDNRLIKIGGNNMQFLVYDPNFDPQKATPPTPELMEEMGKFVGETIQAGVLVTTGALQAQGTRLRLSNGKFTVTDGPFIELKELMGGWAVLRTNSLEEAIEWSKRFRKLVGDGESEIVRIFGPEDAGPA